jgi:hypothetical protein
MTILDPLEFLLDLDGEVIVQERGCWVKIEARKRNPSPHVPHPDGRTIKIYEFTDAGKLVEDFFAAVDQVLKDRGMT